MTLNRTRTTDQSQGAPQVSIADLIDRLSRFDGPPDQFLVNMLAVQCAIGWAAGGTILRPGADGKAEVLAVYPPLAPNAAPPTWLSTAAEQLAGAMNGGGMAVLALRSSDDMYGAPPAKHLIFLPLRSGANVRGIAAFCIDSGDTEVVQASRQRLELTLSLLSLYEMRLTLQHRQFDMQRMKSGLEVVSAINDPDRFTSVSMTLVNELASRWQCHRVALGFLKGRYVQVKGLSHTEKFNRKMALVQSIESAMEECIDQDVEVIHPPVPGSTYVARAAEEMSRKQGAGAILLVPLRRNGEPVGVLSLERPADRPFTIEEVEAVRLAADLCTARIYNLYLHDRWFGARTAANARKAMGALVGPKHTWIKLIVIGVFAFLAFVFFAKGDYNAEGSFTIDAADRVPISMPFRAQINIDKPRAEIGDVVVANQTVLAELVDEDLVRSLEAKREELAEAQGKEREALAKSVLDPAQLAIWQQMETLVAKLKIEVGLLEYRLGQMQIKSPVSGQVIAGDLKRQGNKTKDVGEPLFEVCPLEMLRAEIDVPEDQIASVGVGMTGELATTASPDRRLRFTVERINPVAEVVQQQNVFKVRVLFDADDLAAAAGWLRPGMEGVAKINIDRRSYAYLWTRKIVNWVRMKLWV